MNYKLQPSESTERSTPTAQIALLDEIFARHPSCAQSVPLAMRRHTQFPKIHTIRSRHAIEATTMFPNNEQCRDTTQIRRHTIAKFQAPSMEMMHMPYMQEDGKWKIHTASEA
jgi:hypothetical protein